MTAITNANPLLAEIVAKHEGQQWGALEYAALITKGDNAAGDFFVTYAKPVDFETAFREAVTLATGDKSPSVLMASTGFKLAKGWHFATVTLSAESITDAIRAAYRYVTECDSARGLKPTFQSVQVLRLFSHEAFTLATAVQAGGKPEALNSLFSADGAKAWLLAKRKATLAKIGIVANDSPEAEAKAKADAEAKAIADKAEAEARLKAQAAEAKRLQDADAAKSEAERAKANAEAEAETERAKAEAERVKADAKAEAERLAKAKAEADTKAAQAEAETAKAKAEAAEAKAKADKAEAEAAEAKAKADKANAEAGRADANAETPLDAFTALVIDAAKRAIRAGLAVNALHIAAGEAVDMAVAELAEARKAEAVVSGKAAPRSSRKAA